MTTNQTIDGVPVFYAIDPLDAYPEPVGTDDKIERSNGALWVHLNGKRSKLIGLQSLDFLISQLVQIKGEIFGTKPVAQTQVKPVAWQYRVSAGPQTGWSLWHDGKGEEFKQSYQVETRPLYAEQTAPVAVVMPDPLQDPGMIAGLSSRYAQGWNACLDEVAKLNKSKGD